MHKIVTIPDDPAVIQRDLDIVKSKVFLGRNAAFFGSIMSSLDFKWSDEVETAATDGESFWWNLKDFYGLPEEERCSTIEHELQHVARLHMLRGEGREPQIWNIACDVRINRDLRKEGHNLPLPMWIPDMPECPHEAEEEIYDWLKFNNRKPQSGGNQDGHMLPSKDPGAKQKAINTVVKAIHQAKMMGAPGTIPGGLEERLEKFLAPIIDWRSKLKRFFSDQLDEDYTWRRPNRRHDPDELYLPSRYKDEGRLRHLMYFLDVSGSVSQADLVRFNSEVKFIKSTFNPEKITLVQFDTRISDVQVITENDQFDGITIKGRGGTSLAPVRAYIEEHKPTVAVIFSDLICQEMAPLNHKIPVLWVAIGSHGHTPSYGEVIRIGREK